MYSCLLNRSITTNELTLPIDGFHITLHSKVSEIAIQWNSAAGDNIFMRSAFLTALEETPPSGTSYRYALVHKEDKIVGIIYYQVKKNQSL